MPRFQNNILKGFNAEWLTGGDPSLEQIENLSEIISLKNASSDFCLDDPNLTKSSSLANLKQTLTRQINFDFKNLTKNVLNQKESNLCVPLSVSVLLRWAIKNDLKSDDWEMEEYLTLEKIFTALTMGGLNINLQELQNLYICIWKAFSIDRNDDKARKSDENCKIGDFDCLP